MNKDDLELFGSFKKRNPLKMILQDEYKKYSLTEMVQSSFMAEAVWGFYYPINEDKMLMSYCVNGYAYSIEITSEQYDDTDDSVFIERIKKEIKFIKENTEKFYFFQVKNGVDSKKSTQRIMKEFKSDHKDGCPIRSLFKIKKGEYIMVGKDKGHLARTTIFIANS